MILLDALHLQEEYQFLAITEPFTNIIQYLSYSWAENLSEASELLLLIDSHVQRLSIVIISFIKCFKRPWTRISHKSRSTIETYLQSRSSQRLSSLIILSTDENSQYRLDLNSARYTDIISIAAVVSRLLRLYSIRNRIFRHQISTFRLSYESTSRIWTSSQIITIRPSSLIEMLSVTDIQAF